MRLATLVIVSLILCSCAARERRRNFSAAVARVHEQAAQIDQTVAELRRAVDEHLAKSRAAGTKQ